MDEKRVLSHKEFIILGLVAEEPNGSHAYQINKKIEERGMRDWTNIGRTSIYRILKKLKADGLLSKWTEEEDNRIVKIHQITPKGSEVLKNNVYRVLNEFTGKNDPDFYVAFSMLPLLNKEEQIEVFTNSLRKIRFHKKELEDMLEENSHMPLNVRGLFVHPIKILGIDIDFLDWVLKEIKEGKGKVDSEKHGK